MSLFWILDHVTQLSTSIEHMKFIYLIRWNSVNVVIDTNDWINKLFKVWSFRLKLKPLCASLYTLQLELLKAEIDGDIIK